jgi:polysaccharide biosynthesis transport protein
VPEGPGLAEVLTGEATPEEAIVVVNQAGGFYLLPAGGDGLDPSRLLQGDALGQLLGRLRETFDTVLIDVPPILPVADALLVGRWTDGAVLAVRHDTSRFPLVAQARKRLAAIGIPVLGAVLNGCRPTASAHYGAYGTYSHDRADADEDVSE